MPFAVANFMQVDSIRLFQDDTSSISILMYLTWLCNFSLLLFILKSGSCGKFFCWDLNISPVLVSFRDSIILCNHSDRSFSSWLTTDSIVPSFIAGNRRLVASAK